MPKGAHSASRTAAGARGSFQKAAECRQSRGFAVDFVKRIARKARHLLRTPVEWRHVNGRVDDTAIVTPILMPSIRAAGSDRLRQDR